MRVKRYHISVRLLFFYPAMSSLSLIPICKTVKQKPSKSAKTEEKTAALSSAANINECNFCTIELWWRRWYDVCVCVCFFALLSSYLWNVKNNAKIAEATTTTTKIIRFCDKPYFLFRFTVCHGKKVSECVCKRIGASNVT